jgi:hypothetical protein
MAAVTSAIGAGTQGAVGPLPCLRALSTVAEAGMLPISKIWVQR